MTEDQIIDKVLNELSVSDPGTLSLGTYFEQTLKMPDFAYTQYVDRLETLGLAKPTNPRHRMLITDHGRQVMKKGGWLAFKAEQTITDRQKEEREKLELDLTKSNIEANRLNIKNSRFNKWTTLANILLGLLNIGLLIWQLKNMK